MTRRETGATGNPFTALKRKCSSWIWQRCKEQGCELKYRRSSGQRGFIINCDQYRDDNGIAGKVADCLFIEFTGAFQIVVVELKRGNVEPDRSVQQIQATLSIADQLLRDYRVEMSLPVLVSGKGLHPDDFRVLHRKEVVFRSLHGLVVTARCGDSLNELIRRYGSQYRVPEH